MCQWRSRSSSPLRVWIRGWPSSVRQTLLRMNIKSLPREHPKSFVPYLLLFPAIMMRCINDIWLRESVFWPWLPRLWPLVDTIKYTFSCGSNDNRFIPLLEVLLNPTWNSLASSFWPALSSRPPRVPLIYWMIVICPRRLLQVIMSLQLVK